MTKQVSKWRLKKRVLMNPLIIYTFDFLMVLIWTSLTTLPRWILIVLILPLRDYLDTDLKHESLKGKDVLSFHFDLINFYI